MNFDRYDVGNKSRKKKINNECKMGKYQKLYNIRKFLIC